MVPLVQFNVIMENLVFHKTMSIEQFKAAQKIDTLEVRRNPKTSKLFLTWIGGTGAVSSKGIPSKRPVISLVKGEEGDFYLLHEQGEGAPTVATF